jgi:hypothetical protein
MLIYFVLRIFFPDPSAIGDPNGSTKPIEVLPFVPMTEVLYCKKIQSKPLINSRCDLGKDQWNRRPGYNLLKNMLCYMINVPVSQFVY